MNNDPTTHTIDPSFLDGLVQLSFTVHSILGQVGAEHDLSIIQIRLLGILRDREPSMMQLAQYLNLDKSSITGLIDRAERRGLVQRTISPVDRRGFHVSVTPAGKQLIQVASQEIKNQILAITANLTQAERSQLTALANKILNH
ncbi:MarR family winged helix-turn-helix transcriptional regulator [Paenibacillus sp. P36]|uniref:MarR family winged helix-turn-helix transcriptional regulator n=1 Tax=Paenibacillus sp. P36 TaxID=3342538 RepID=UPI0038B3B457